MKTLSIQSSTNQQIIDQTVASIEKLITAGNNSNVPASARRLEETSTQNRKLQSQGFGLIFENGPKTVEVRNIQYPTDEQVESAQRLSSMLGFGSAAQSDVVDAGLLVLGFTPFDPYFSLIKFAQGTKLVTRHRFIGVEHGRLFTAYQGKAN